MRRRGCLISFAAMAGLLLLCCLVGVFFGLPRLQDSVSDAISEELSTEVANQLDQTSGTLAPGTYTLQVDDLQRAIDDNMDSSTTSDFGISVDQTGIQIDFDSGSQSFEYSGMPVARDGKLVIEDMKVDDDWLGRLMPADKVANTIEDGINDYFAARNLQIDNIDLGNDEIVFTVSEAGT